MWGPAPSLAVVSQFPPGAPGPAEGKPVHTLSEHHPSVLSLTLSLSFSSRFGFIPWSFGPRDCQTQAASSGLWTRVGIQAMRTQLSPPRPGRGGLGLSGKKPQPNGYVWEGNTPRGASPPPPQSTQPPENTQAAVWAPSFLLETQLTSVSPSPRSLSQQIHLHPLTTKGQH